MAINRLPEYLINKLKAGEIVERPASIVKELIENSLDAGASKIVIDLVDGGKKLIKIEDDGTGIDIADMPLVIERYATSKIAEEKDLYNISQYGFRGEALASISEVSKFKIQTKTTNDYIASQLTKIGEEIIIDKIVFPYEHGTIVFVEDVFYNTPARQKFLKSSQTEYYYIYELFVNFALVHWNLHLIFKKDGKIIFDLNAKDNFLDRFFDIYKKDREKNIKPMSYDDGNVGIYGILGDSGLTFGSPENIKLFVNKRPVQDKIIKKAVLSAYDRQIASGEYPLSVLFLDIKPELVDVNIHPRKLEVKFLDPGSVFTLVNNVIKKAFSDDQFIGTNITDYASRGAPSSNIDTSRQHADNKNQPLGFEFKSNIYSNNEFVEQISDLPADYKIIGQIMDSYIIVESQDSMFIVDQHALAERIAFQKLKNDVQKIYKQAIKDYKKNDGKLKDKGQKF